MRKTACAWLAGFVIGAGWTQDKNTRLTPPPGENMIDKILAAKWQELKITPNRLSSDEEFLRRVTLDLTGTIPEPEDVVAFVKSTDPRKRDKKIDDLMASASWAGFWADRLTGVFVGHFAQRQVSEMDDAAEQYLREHLKKGTPYNQMVEEIVTAKGSSKETHSIAFAAIWTFKDRQKKNFASQVARLFMGIQLQCAQCHDHPFEKWTKDDFYSVVANFAGVMYKYDKDTREIDITENHRRGGKEYVPEGYKTALSPKFIDGTPISSDNPRAEFAKMLVSSENLQFARATVNRIWSFFTGQGFVEPVDDFNVRNRPSVPELLDALAKGFVDNSFDLKWLMRTITTSKTYQLSSHRKSNEFKEEARKYYAYAVVRPMTSEQMFRSLIRAQDLDHGVAGATAGAGKAGGGGKGMKGKGGGGGNPAAIRNVFYRQIEMTSEASPSPGDYTASIQQIMRMLNMDSPLYRGTHAKGAGRLSKILSETKKPEEVMAKLYLATVSRVPTSAEMADCMKYYHQHGASSESFSDIFFVLLNTNEFFFNH